MTPAVLRCSRIALAGALLLGGCLLGPNYHRPPTTPYMGEWREPDRTFRDSSYANLAWWSVLGDSVLQRLVLEALKENRDLHAAIAHVNEARAQLGIQRYESYPQVDILSSYRRANGADSAISGTGQRTVVFIEANISWEADLWGRIRRLNEAAQATLLANEEDRRGVIMAVVSDAARAYLELRDLDAQAAIAQSQVDIRTRSLQLARARFQGGLTSELDVRQGENALAVAEETRASALRQRRQKENELSILMGHPPEPIPRGLPLSEQQFAYTIPAGLPSDLLQRRPDIRAAEEQLRAANARIGAAIAALFPTVQLTASTGTVSSGLRSLFHPGTGFWHVAANVTQPVLNKDKNKQQVALEQARTDAAVAQYEKTVLTAFREVEDGLVAVQRFREEEEAAARAATAARRSVFLSNLRYEGGVDTYTNVLDAQRAQLDAELQESQLQRQRKVAVVQLYKALGGGWDPVTDTLAVPRPLPPPPPFPPPPPPSVKPPPPR